MYLNYKQLQNKVPRKITDHRRKDATSECRRLHAEEISDLYSSPNIIRMFKSSMPGCGMYEMRGACKVLVVKPETTC